MALEVVALAQEHLAPAVDLFCASYREFRRRLPVMPERYERPDVVLPPLRSLASKCPGVAALDDGRLVGYLAGFLVPNLKGRDSGVYCPEYGHAVARDAAPERAWIYRKMYESVARTWVSEKCLNHSLTILANDREAVEAWFWSGFGMIVVDMVRGIEPLAPAGREAAGPPVRRAGAADVRSLLPLLQEHELYYTGSPMFMLREPPGEEAEYATMLDDPEVAYLIADDGKTILGFLRIQTSQGDASAVVRDPGTAAISGAYVRPVLRGHGFGRALVESAIAWAKERGCSRISLDFEAANLQAARFWPKYFAPACYSLFRHVDDRVGGVG